MKRDGRDDWVAYECAGDLLADICSRLKTGSAKLNADECALVLANLQAPAPPKYRPADVGNAKIYAALYCLNLERDGMPTKNAVAVTAVKFGCSRWTVNTARRNMLQK